MLCFFADTATLQEAAATWIIKTRESHRIPISVMDSIIQDVQSLYEVALTQHVQRILHDAGVASSTRATVAKEFTDGTYTHIFTGLKCPILLCRRLLVCIHVYCIMFLGTGQDCVGNEPKTQKA